LSEDTTTSADPLIVFRTVSTDGLRPRHRPYHGPDVPVAAILPFFSALAGGFAALRLRHRLHAIMALAAGVVVATAVADLLPEAFALVGEGRQLEVGIAAGLGFIG